MRRLSFLLSIFLFGFINSCVEKKVLFVTTTDYLNENIENKVLLIAPISDDIKIGPMVDPENKDFVNHYYLDLINHLDDEILKFSNFKSVYYCNFPVFNNLGEKVFYLSETDSFHIELPTQKSDFTSFFNFKKLKPDFVLYFKVELIDFLTNISSSNYYSRSTSVNFNFTLAQRIKHAIWDIKERKVVCYARRDVAGKLPVVAESIVDSSPFHKE